jgi:hypothetical protein
MHIRPITILAVILLVGSLLLCLCCSTSSSRAYLERKDSKGQWVRLRALGVSPPIIDRNGNLLIAAIIIHRRSFLSSESIVLQAKLSRYQPFGGHVEPVPTFIDGLANGKLLGNPFLGGRLVCTSAKLYRNDDGKLCFGGTFLFGKYRIDLLPMDSQETKSYQDARLRFGDFDADRIPKSWDLEEICEAAAYTYVEDHPIDISRVKAAKILAWKIEEDRHCWVHECIVWLRLENPAQWVLVYVFRNKFPEEGWLGWCRAWAEYGDSYWIKYYDHPPISQEIEIFLKANEWWLLQTGSKLLDAEICAKAWKKVTGQDPSLKMPSQINRQNS